MLFGQDGLIALRLLPVVQLGVDHVASDEVWGVINSSLRCFSRIESDFDPAVATSIFEDELLLCCRQLPRMDVVALSETAVISLALERRISGVVFANHASGYGLVEMYGGPGRVGRVTKEHDLAWVFVQCDFVAVSWSFLFRLFRRGLLGFSGGVISHGSVESIKSRVFLFRWGLGSAQPRRAFSAYWFTKGTPFFWLTLLTCY